MMQFLTAAAALAFVVALIFITASLGRWISPWLACRFGTRSAASPRGIGVSCQIDLKRRLHVAELEGRKFVVLTGGPNDVMIALPEGSNKDHRS